MLLGTGHDAGGGRHAAERPLAQAIRTAPSDRPDRADRLSDDLASLARAARVAIGNDTGPMHLIAAAGCPAVVLFSRDSDPGAVRPAGPSVTVLRRPDLARSGRRRR